MYSSCGAILPAEELSGAMATHLYAMLTLFYRLVKGQTPMCVMTTGIVRQSMS